MGKTFLKVFIISLWMGEKKNETLNIFGGTAKRSILSAAFCSLLPGGIKIHIYSSFFGKMKFYDLSNNGKTKGFIAYFYDMY